MIAFLVSKKTNNSINCIKVNDCYVSWVSDESRELQIRKVPSKIYFEFRHERVVEINLKKFIVNFFRGRNSRIPLFYFQSSEEIIIFSHFKIAKMLGLKILEEKENIAEFIHFGYVFPPNTIYKDVKRVLFNETLEIRLTSNLQIRIKKEGIFSDSSKKEIDLSEIKEALRRSVFNGIKQNDKVSLLFSGGLDSTVILKFFLNQKRKINCLSTGFKFEKVDEIEKNNALDSAKILNADHVHNEFTNNEFLKALILSIYFSEEPIMHMQSVLLFLLFSKYNHHFSKIILNGQGADGVFGQNLQYQLYQNKKKFDVKSELNTLANLDWLRDKLKYSKKQIVKNREFFLNQIKDSNKQNIIFAFDLLGDVDITQTCWTKCAESQDLDLYYPYLDKGLIRKVSKLSWQIKLAEPKKVLREIAREMDIPESIIGRKKGNFGPVSINWGKYLSPLLPLCAPFFAKPVLRELRNDPKKRYLLWNIINLSIWRMLFIDAKDPNDIINKIFIRTK